MAGGVFTAAQFNTYVRDNLNQLAPAKSTTVSSWFPVSAVNQLTERFPTQNNASGSSTTTATSYGNLADGVTTAVTVSTGTMALVMLYTNFSGTSGGANRIWMSYEISGATTAIPSDTRSLHHTFVGGLRFGASFLHTGLTAGSNTFTLRYRVTAGTGTYTNRRIAVIPF